jgi:hypothetical protein
VSRSFRRHGLEAGPIRQSSGWQVLLPRSSGPASSHVVGKEAGVGDRSECRGCFQLTYAHAQHLLRISTSRRHCQGLQGQDARQPPSVLGASVNEMSQNDKMYISVRWQVYISLTRCRTRFKGVLPLPNFSVLGAFLNEMCANDKDYMSRHMFVASRS